MKTISLQDIAKELGISKATISYVLNGRGDEKRISKDTQAKIKMFAKEHNYKANHLARSLSRGKSDMIGLVVPNISDVFYARIARRIEQKARTCGYNVVFSSSGESKEIESELIQSMLDRRVDGLIIGSSQQNQKDILRLKKRNFPFVLIDRYYPEIDTNYVVMDNTGGIALLVEQLINSGKKRIAFVTLTKGLEPISERLLSYKRTMENHGLAIETGFIQELEYKHVETDIHNIIKKLINLPSGIDGIVFATHYLAADGLRELRKLDVRIPEDVAIVSFGQMRSFDIIEPPITSVLLPSNDIGDKAVDILLHNINESKSEFENIRFETELVVRRSCGTK